MQVFNRLFLFFVLSLIPLMANAVHVKSIYKAEIPVESRSSEDRLEALKTGLQEVFIKVSGNMRVLDNNPTLKHNLDSAEKYAKDVEYVSLPGNESSSLVSMRFEPDTINKLLKDAGANVWSQSRPLIITWVVLDTPTHTAEIIDGQSVGEFQTLFKKASKRRGLATIMPLMDLREVSTISVDDIKNKAIAKINAASKRYASNSVLVGYIQQSEKSDELTSDWTFLTDGQEVNWTITEDSLSEVLTTLTNNIADLLAKNYAVTLEDVVQSEITLRIQNVKSHLDLIQIMKSIQQLPPVSEVHFQRYANDEVHLNVTLKGSKKSFIDAMAQEKELVPTTSNLIEDDTLIYKYLIHQRQS